MSDNGTQSHGQRRHMPSPLIFSPDAMPPPALPAVNTAPSTSTTTATSTSTSTGGGIRMPFVKNHVTRRLKAAKTECDKELQRITNNITAFFEGRVLRENESQFDPDSMRPMESLQRRNSQAATEPDTLRDAFAIDDLRSVLQAEDVGSDGGYEAESENALHSRHHSNASPVLSPVTLRRNNSSPWDRINAPPPSANVNVPTSSRASTGGGSESGSLRLSNYAASPPSSGSSAWPVHAPSARRLSRTVHRPVPRQGHRSGQSSRSTSRSRSPLPRPPKLNSSMSSSHRRSRVFLDDPLDPSLTALYELIAVATDVMESTTSQITQPKVCEQLVQRVQIIGRAWDENPEWQGRNWYVQVLLAVASLSRVVEWWEAEKQFWNFDDNDDAEDEPLTFVMKPSEELVETSLSSPFLSQEPSREEDQLSMTGQEEETEKLSRSQSIGRKSRDAMPKDLSIASTPPVPEEPQPAYDATKLAESQRVLATERLKLQVETAQNQNIVMELSLDGDHVVWVNYAWRVVVGTDPDDLGGTRISRALAPDDSDVFHTATQLLLQDDSHTVEVCFRLQLNPSKGKEPSTPKYLQMEGKGMLMFDREDSQPSHTMWVVRPIPESRFDQPLSIPEGAEAVKDNIAAPITPMRSFTQRASVEPATPLPFSLPISTAPILCRICECQIPQWYFEKHSETCVEVHRLEAEIADCNDSIQELRNTIRDLSATVDRASPAIVPEYRGMPIFSPSSSPTAASPLSIFRSNKLQRMNVKKIQRRFLEQLEDILSIASEVSIPSLKDEEAQEPIERQRLLSPTSERKMSQVRNWTKPAAQDPALGQLAGDAERIMRQKIDHVVRMQNTIRYSEKIWHEWQERVLEHMDENGYHSGEDDSGGEGSSEEAPHSADEVMTAPASSRVALTPTTQSDEEGLSSQPTPIASTSPVPFTPMQLASTSAVSLAKPNDRLTNMLPPPVPLSAFSSPTPSMAAMSLPILTSAAVAPPASTSAGMSAPISIPAGVPLPKSSSTAVPALTSAASSSTLSPGVSTLAMPMATPVSASWQSTGKLSKAPTRSSTPSSVSSPLALAAPIVASDDAVPPISLGDSTKSTHLTVRTRPSTASLLDPNSNITPPGSPVVSSREGAGSRRGHRRLSTAANIVLSPGGSASNVISPRAPSVAPISRTQPTTIKDFEIIKPISKGAFGSVFLAKKRTTGDYFAIKVLKKADMIAKNQITNVKAERMILMNQSESPYVAKLYFTFQSKENLYLVMEYLNGGDCAALIKSLGTLPEEWTKNYIAEVVLGLEYLHQRGVVHRDLKPDNLLIDHQGHLKLTDFGLSRTGLLGRQTREVPSPMNPRSRYHSRSRPPSVDSSGFLPSPLMFPDNPDDVSESSGSESFSGVIPRRHAPKKSESPMQSFATELTNDLRSHSSDLRSQGVSTPPGAQKFVGTPDYLAPETILGLRGDDAAVDWWALGVVTYEFLYGIPPFHAETPEKVFENILSGHVEWHEEWVDFSDEALDFMRCLLNVDPGARLGAKGSEEVKAHPFFHGIEWDNVTKNTAAFIPQVTDPESTDYFDPRGAIHQHFHDDDDTAASVANSESPGATYNPLTGAVSSVALPVPILGARDPPDDFGSFSFKNLPVLKQANDDMIRKMKTDQLIPMAHANSDSSVLHARKRSVSHRIKKGLPNVVTSVSNPDQQKYVSPPSPSTSTSSVASSPSRTSMPSITSGSAAHSRKPSEFGAVERFKLNHLDGIERRNTMPSRLRTASISTSSGGDGSGSEQWQSSGGHASPQFDFGTPPSSVHSVDLRRGPDPADRALTCLLAEDNPITAKMIETLLIRLGCRCVVVGDGSEAISVAMGDIKFDCILMDLHMPVLDGEGAARYIKSTNSKNTHTPIIAVSAYGALEGEAAGLFVTCLPKPLQKADLLPVMTKLGFRVGSNPGAAMKLTTRASTAAIPA